MVVLIVEHYASELSNAYQHDRVQMAFKNGCILVLWMKVASALEGLRYQAYMKLLPDRVPPAL